MKEVKIFTLNDFDSINIEFNKKEKNILSLLNECKLNNKTVFVNNRFSFGNKRLYPTITLCYLENSNNLKLKNNSFVSIFEMKKYIGYYSSTKSIINELLNKESILYKHKIFNTNDYFRFKDSFYFLNKQKINKNLYFNYSEDKLKILKESFNNKFVIGIGYNLNVNTFPDSLIYALDELNRENIKVNLYIFNEKNNITNEQKIILNSKPFIKQSQVKLSHKLNYLRLCNMLASTCHDYLNEIGPSMVIDEYLLCDKPIICSYGKEREEQLGKDYPGFYNCSTCYTVPPMMWTKSYLSNKTNYDYLQRKFFKHKYIDKLNEILRIKQIIQNNLNYKKIIIEKSIFESININILLHCHSILDNMSGDTIMIINFIKKMLVNNNVSFITKYDPSIIYKNIKDKSKLRVIKTNNIMSNIDELSNTHDVIILRNGKLINKLIDKPYLNKTIIYGLDSNINELQSLQNSFLNIITQSQQLKDFFIENGIEENKIIVQEPIAKKYDFDLPERTDNEIRLIYCGTLRDEENILEIIEEFQKIHKERPEVVLKIVYGKIKGDIEFEKKIKNIIKQGVKGIVFKHDLSHKDACYEIATSDIGICWRKPGWGDNGEISTKVKEYEMYGLEIINDFKIKVGVVTSTNKLNKIDNIIKNFKNQLYFNKKLFLVINNNNICIKDVQKKMTEHNILYEILNVDEKLNLGHCLNNAIKKLKEQHYDIFSKFDDDDIYEKKYLLEQIYYLNKYNNCIVGKYNVPLFIPEHNNFYTITNFTKNNQFAEICRGSTITFNLNNITHQFDKDKTQGVDTIFLKEHLINDGKIYVSSFNNYIWIRYLDNNKHTWKLDVNKYNLKMIDDKQLKYKYKYYLNDNSYKKYYLNSKKIYLIIWQDENKAKGINIDCEIIYNTLVNLNYNVFYLTIPLSYLTTFNVSNNKILLDGDIYIFSEVCYSDIYDFIFKNNKDIICVPNIDSYSTYKPIIKDRETDFINSLKKYSKKNNFNIWCKTKQIYNWLKKCNLTNIHYIHFTYNILPNFNDNKINNTIKKIFSDKKVDYLLLDTGNSTTKRKYLEEVLDIFVKNKNIPFTLLVKTTPKVYNKFIKNTKYDNQYSNIKIITEMLMIDELIYIYKYCKYFVYCSKFDGYGLSLAQAIKYNLFIFTFDGLPWCELLESYPRKCLVKCTQDMSKSMGVKIKGKALSQIYYKGDFGDLTHKLKNNKDKYEKIISETYEECQFVNKYNNKVFTSNIKNYFQKKYNLCNIYNNTSVGVVSYLDREKIFIENLMNIILQANDIVIYLNSATDFIKTFLSNISNVHVVYCDKDLKSLTKLKVINYLNNDVNLIIDDDIVYPSDYIEYTYNILKKQKDKKSFYSYNGYTDKFKYPFTLKTELCLQDNCNLGSGSLFYNKNTLTYNKLEQFLEKILRISVDSNIQLFCDKILLQFCQENKIKTRIISPKHTYWMINNPKMKYGLLELKKELNIYDLKDIQKINFKDKLININNNLPNNILRFFSNKIDIIDKSIDYFNYYQIYIKDNILYIDNNSNNIFNLDLNKFKDSKSLNKIFNSIICEISKLYNKDN